MERVNVIVSFNSNTQEVKPLYIMADGEPRKIETCQLIQKMYNDRTFKCVYHSDREHIIELKYSPTETRWYLMKAYK